MNLFSTSDKVYITDGMKQFIISGRGNDQIFTLDGRDIIHSGEGSDFVSTGANHDRIYSGRGDDMVLGGWGQDYIRAGSGADYLYGGADEDRLMGDDGHDYLDGGDGDDYLSGGRGNDILKGGLGNDILNGGSGSNAYHFNVSDNHNEGHDTIRLFGRNDKLVFHGLKDSEDLDNAIDHIQQHGRFVHIYFNNGASIQARLNTRQSIEDTADLIQAFNIEFEQEYRSMTGEYNNPIIDDMGAVQTHFMRLASADFADGISAPSGEDRPNARLISNTLFAQDSAEGNPFNASDMFWLWGQFIDHDITLAGGESEEPFHIQVPLGDPFFDPFGTGTQVIPMMRSEYNHNTGEVDTRQHDNDITAYLDASMIYGADDLRAAFLRNPDGTLKTSPGNLLPFNNGAFENANSDSTELFLAGDIRANENVALTSLHTLFVREHNRLVEILRNENPDWHGEQLYQEAKKIVNAEIQSITYHEFLPLLVGKHSISEYTGYDQNVNPSMSHEFATAAFRLGHTLLSSEVERLFEDGSIADSHLSLRHAFFNPGLIVEEGIENILRGVAQGQAEAVDLKIIDDVRNFLFGPPGAGGLDLGALNIQRGRDHGLADYNTVREAMGLPEISDFSELTNDPTLQATLAGLYDIDNIDLFVGLLAEDPIPGSQLGSLLQAIIVDQFERTRDGDRFWYENILNPEEIAFVESIKLSDVIEMNTDITQMQQWAMQSYQRIGGDDLNNTLLGGDSSDLILGFSGDDILQGNAGDDDLAGGLGLNSLSGGLGNDTFIYNGGLDTILDFALSSDEDPENDLIDLSATQLTFEQLSFNQVGLDTHISALGTHFMTLTEVEVSMVTADDFYF